MSKPQTTPATDIEASPLNDLTGFQRDLLVVLDRLDDPHGLAVKEELEADYEKQINHGRLYPNLDDLVKRGLAEKGQKDRRTNKYWLTERGERELDAHREWSSNDGGNETV